MSLNGCAFSSGGGTPEDAREAEWTAFLFVTGKDGGIQSIFEEAL